VQIFIVYQFITSFHHTISYRIKSYHIKKCVLISTDVTFIVQKTLVEKKNYSIRIDQCPAKWTNIKSEQLV